MFICPCSSCIVVFLTVSEVDPGELQHCLTRKSRHMLCLPNQLPLCSLASSQFNRSMVFLILGYSRHGIKPHVTSCYKHRSDLQICATTFLSNNNCSTANDEKLDTELIRCTQFDTIWKIHRNPFGNGTAVFTRSGAASRKFIDEIEAGQVGL